MADDEDVSGRERACPQDEGTVLRQANGGLVIHLGDRWRLSNFTSTITLSFEVAPLPEPTSVQAALNVLRKAGWSVYLHPVQDGYLRLIAEPETQSEDTG